MATTGHINDEYNALALVHLHSELHILFFKTNIIKSVYSYTMAYSTLTAHSLMVRTSHELAHTQLSTKNPYITLSFQALGRTASRQQCIFLVLLYIFSLSSLFLCMASGRIDALVTCLNSSPQHCLCSNSKSPNP